MSGQPQRRRKYDAAFKKTVIQASKDSSSSAAARHYCISEKLVRDWRKAEKTIKEMPSTKCANRGQNQEKWPRLEKEIATWVLSERQCGRIVTRALIRLKALQWAAKNKEDGLNFKATVSWCSRFMHRHDLVIRQKTKIAQKLPKDLDHKITQFQTFVINQRKRNEYGMAHIGNMDETPMFFDVVGNTTINKKGEKTILVKTTGHEKQHFTVVLACLADGTKLPPMIIFKRKTMPKDKFPPGVVIHVQEKGWMDDSGCVKWINEVWARRPGAMLKPKSLLVWDMFKSHLTDTAKKLLKSKKTDMAVIPGGLTSVLQPLDVSLNKPFKDSMRTKWNEWMASGQQTYTAAGNMRAASLPTVCQWVKDSWDSIDPKVVVNSFKKCSITNAMDGTEDDMLWEEDDDIPTSSVEQDIIPEEDPYDDNLNGEEWDFVFNRSHVE